MSKIVIRYKMDHKPYQGGELFYVETNSFVPHGIQPAELIAASDYDGLKANFDVLVKACRTISTGLMKHSAAAIAYEALKEVNADE